MPPVGDAESFGRYELIRLVGAGGMALVHLARQRGPEGFVKPCVLKRIAPEASQHESVRQMFIEEARISALLNHPNIVQTFDYGSVDGQPYLAMELIDGINLAQFCRTLAKKKRWLPVRPAVDICIKLLEALQYAHDLNDLDGRPLRLVHRDVSPQNTLLSRQGVVKLADFGIARHEARQAHTRAGETAKGKPGYMAPEQAMGDAVDGRADLFSVGILLTELVSARRVMAQSGAPVGVLGIADRIRTLFAYRPESPAPLHDLAQRLCALDPNHRPATAMQAAAELRAAVANAPASQPVEQFLRQVFLQHIPNDPLGAALSQSGSASPSPSPPIPEPALINDPTEGQVPSGPEGPSDAVEEVQTAWARPEPPPSQGTAQAYGWPKEFLPEAEPKLELVSRSSGVDAMKYFGAQESEAVQQGRVELPTPTAEGPSNPGDPLMSEPVSDPGLNRALRYLRTPIPGQPVEPPAGSTPKKRRPTRRREIPPVVPLAVAGLAIVIGGIVVVSAFSSDDAPVKAAALPDSGQLTITSTPQNAKIYIDRRDTGQTTPKTISALPLSRPLRVSVRLPLHLSIPRDITIRIPPSTGQTSAHFTLKEGRVITLNSVPEGAVVTVNGERLIDVTPVKLEAIPFGQTATITVEQQGYLPKQLLIKATPDSPATTEVKLEPAKMVDVLSEPPGAEVFIDGVARGRTPLYDVSVPTSRRFRVTMKKVGFKRWTRRLRPRQITGAPVIAELTGVALMGLPMSKTERTRARAMQRTIARYERDVKKLKYQLQRAMRRLESLEARSSPLIGPIAEAQRNVDLVRDELMKREEALAEARSKREVFREQLLLKAEMDD